MNPDDLFDEITDMPNPDASRRFDMLVGLDYLKQTILKEAKIAMDPQLLEKWSREKHGSILPCLEQLRQRPKLMMFHGDAGTGKTTLADSLGDPVARAQGITVRLFRLSLTARGQGAVGQMTRLITDAFGEVAKAVGRGSGGARSAAVLVIDEADALAESRETDQMHHEDRAGVNALIRGIDRLAKAQLPVLVILCTNRSESLDPAILRRAAISYEFKRPDAEQRRELFRRAFGGIFDDKEYDELVRLTEPDLLQELHKPKRRAEAGVRQSQDPADRPAGYSFSDIVQRIVPNIILEAFSDEAVSFDIAKSVVSKTEPTRPFYKDGGRE